MSKRTGRAAVRYVASGALAFGVSAGVTALLHEVGGWSPQRAYAVALVCVMVLMFFVARYYVFAGTDRGMGQQAVMFLASSLIFRGAEYAMFWLFHVLLGVPYLAAIVVAQGISFVTKFVVFHGLIFARRKVVVEGAPS